KKGYKNPLRYAVTSTPSLGENSSSIELQAIQGGLIVNGAVSSLAEHQRVIASAGKNAIDATHSTGAIQVQTDVRIVEISRNELKSLSGGISITELLSSNSATSLLLRPFSNLADSGSPSISIFKDGASRNYNSIINALQTNGYAYTLAEPSLVAMSGQTASFLAGGEFPYPASNQNGDIQIEYREFGVRLKLTPTILADQSIMLKIAPEVSELDFINGLQAGGVSVPSLRVRRTDTSVQLASGESFILSGLISSRTASSIDKFPGLGDIPILGAFFKSTRYEREDKELIMIVTPHLVRPMAAQVPLPELPGEIYRHHNPSFGDMLFGGSQPAHDGNTWASPGVGFAN
ncbi:MAG: pilus assembly protein CpaC, partial [Bacteroidia bacterium]